MLPKIYISVFVTVVILWSSIHVGHYSLYLTTVLFPFLSITRKSINKITTLTVNSYLQNFKKIKKKNPNSVFWLEYTPLLSTRCTDADLKFISKILLSSCSWNTIWYTTTSFSFLVLEIVPIFFFLVFHIEILIAVNCNHPLPQRIRSLNCKILLLSVFTINV